MIINQNPVTVETNIKKSQRNAFGIKADGKLFAILTKNLYSNPILGTLQELGQNCFDSMKLAGKANEPFTVRLPSKLEPQLVIRDTGIGMSHEFVMERYCTAFDSTKDTDENQAGGYGIGKLIALALSDTYTLACYDNGKRRSYSVFMNGDGLPEIVHVNTQDSAEPNGVEVTVPVQEKDIPAFIEATHRAFKYYNPRPIIKGVPNFQFQAIDKSLSGTNWWLDKSLDYPVAVGGIYWYKIEPRDIPGLTNTQLDFLESDMGITLVFGPSEITPQTNRQGLNYDDKTVKAIKTRLDEIEKEVKSVIQKDFDKCANILEAKKLYKSYFRYGGQAHKIGKVLGDTPTVSWKGIPIEDEYLWCGRKNPSDKNKTIWIDGVSAKSFCLSYMRGNWRVKEYDSNPSLEATNYNKFFINDLDGGRGAKYRIGFRLKTDGNKNPAMRDSYYHAIRFKSDEARKEFHKINGTDDSIFEKASEIVVQRDASDISPGDHNEKHRLKLFQFVPKKPNAYRDKNSDWWEPTEIDVDEGGVYLTIRGFTPNAYLHSNERIQQNLEYLLKLNLIKQIPKVYGIKSSLTGKNPPVLDEIKASADWITLDKYIEEACSNVKFSPVAAQNIVDSEQAQYLKHQLMYNVTFSGTILNDYITKAKTIQLAAKKAEKDREIRNALQRLTSKIAELPNKPTYSMVDEWKKVVAAYPLLERFSYISGTEIPLVRDYIETVELANQMRALRGATQIASPAPVTQTQIIAA